jgi:hypothetical protein
MQRRPPAHHAPQPCGATKKLALPIESTDMRG